jgi:hypothetical protein
LVVLVASRGGGLSLAAEGVLVAGVVVGCAAGVLARRVRTQRPALMTRIFDVERQERLVD